MPRYRVLLHCEDYIEVDADDPKEAEALAIEEAVYHKFSDGWYVSYVEEKK